MSVKSWFSVNGTQSFNKKMQDISRQPSTINSSWSNLWDQTELVSSHTLKGIDFLERYGQFLKERATIEEEYASKSLVKKNRVKKNEEEHKLYSYMNAFFSILSELESIAAQHEIIGEKLKRKVFPTLIEKSHILRTSRKKHCNTFQALNTNLQESEDSMLKAQKFYQKAFREAEIAYAKHEKAEKNMDLSRLDLERAKNNVHQKNQHCEQAKQNYARSLELANHAQHDHYNMKLPNLLEDMRKLDMDRIDSTKQAMLDSVHAETSVSNILQRCYSDMETSILSINSENDTSVVVIEHITGFAFPKERIFEDLGCPSSILCGNGEPVLDITGTLKRTTISVGGAKIGKNINGKGIPRKSSMHQRLFGGNANSKSNNNGSSTDGYSNLPPQQKCRKIQFKLDELAKETILKEQARAGLEKMLGVFCENPKMGNANDVDLQLQQNNKELELIAEKADRYKRLLIDAQSELNTPLKGIQKSQHRNALRNVSSYSTTGLSPNGSSPRINASITSLVSSSVTQQRSSYSEDSVSSEGTSSMNDANNSGFLRSSLNSSLTTNTSNAGGNSNGFYYKSSSALASKSNITVAPSVFSNVSVGNNNNGIQHVDSADFYEECDALPKANSLKNLKGTENGISENSFILGTCTALYAFEESSDGTTIAMKEGDEMLLLERDEGDGWTRVRLINSGAGDVLPMEGFVPTTYLQCRWYP